MKIGIDIRAACGKKTGKGWYTFNLIKALVEVDHTNHYILFTNMLAPELATFKGGDIRVVHAGSFLWHFAAIKEWKKIADPGDIFFAPTSFIIPAFLPKEYKTVLTIHDLVAFLHPHLHQTKATIVEQLFMRAALRKTSHVVVPSQNTKQDLHTLFKYDERHITVTPLAADERYEKARELTEEQLQKRQKEVQEKYALPQDFILTVGGLEPRKNADALIDAFLLLEEKYPNLKLVIVGGTGWKSAKVQEKIRGHPQNIIHLQHVSSEDLPFIYQMAKVFLFPSLYEGFGIPPLEAMASGCPVVCSNTSSLPEVCGDGALLINPIKEEIVHAADRIMSDPIFKEHLIKKGTVRAQHFSWKKTAEETLKVFQSAL